MDVSTDSGPEVEEVEEKDPLALDEDEGAELEAVDPYDGPIIPRQTASSVVQGRDFSYSHLEANTLAFCR